MGYAIQMCENQTSGPPTVFRTSIERFPLEQVIMLAKARLETAKTEGTIDGRVAAAVFIRVVELDSGGFPTDRIVFEYKIADKC
jgi:hypothetical protein